MRPSRAPSREQTRGFPDESGPSPVGGPDPSASPRWQTGRCSSAYARGAFLGYHRMTTPRQRREPRQMEASQSVEADPSERAPRRRAVLGLLVDGIEDSYQTELMLRVAEATSWRDASLVVYSGQVLQAGTTHS